MIHVGEAVKDIPLVLMEQLAFGGRMIIPVLADRRARMVQVDKNARGDILQTELVDLTLMINI